MLVQPRVYIVGTELARRLRLVQIRAIRILHQNAMGLGRIRCVIWRAMHIAPHSIPSLDNHTRAARPRPEKRSTLLGAEEAL